MNYRKIGIYTNADGNICTEIIPFLMKRNGKRRYDIFSSYYNPVAGECESVRIYELSPKVRSMKAAEKAIRNMLKKMAGMVVWFTITRDEADRIAAKKGIHLVWRVA